MSRPESRPADDEEIRLVGRATGRQVAAGVVVGLALLGVGVAAGDQEWSVALTTGAVAGTVGGLVVLVGGGPVQRGMERVERVVPARVVRPEPGRGGWV